MSSPRVWSAAACCRFRAGGLLPLDWRGTGEKQASRGKAAASRRTPKKPGAATCPVTTPVLLPRMVGELAVLWGSGAGPVNRCASEALIDA